MHTSIPVENDALTLWDDKGTYVPGMEKWCPACERWKKPDEFYAARSGKNKGKLYSYCIECSRKRYKARYKKHGKSEEKRVREQEANWLRTYGVTEQQYDAMFEAQEGLCAACGCPETEIDARSKKVRMLAIDHDHRTGRVRALLCSACNRALGYFNEDPKRIAGLQRYAEKIQAE